MDTAYWEQTQYVGDTRLESLITYAVSGDSRLAVQAIDAIGDSQNENGLTRAAYPVRSKDSIPPFSLLWINMMHDYWMHEPKVDVLQRNLPRARRVLDWFAKDVGSNGLLKRTSEWYFVDWVGDPPLAREKFPSFDSATGTSCLTSLIYLGALEDDAELESRLGDKGNADDAATKASLLKKAIQVACWSPERGLYADDPSMKVFSQHTNALAVLYDVAAREQESDILRGITLENGIAAPEEVLPASYYFAWYLVRAYEHAGLADKYLELISTWRDLLKLHYTTWPEESGNTRSDTHAWSAHPTDDLLAIVAGVEPASPGYATVRVAPHPGALNYFTATTMTPSGPVKVVFLRKNSCAIFDVELQGDLTGSFQWNGATRGLHTGQNHFEFPGASDSEK